MTAQGEPSGAPRPERGAGGLLDALVLPEPIPFTGPTGLAPRPSGARGFGAFVFWGLAQIVPFIPKGGRVTAGPMRPWMSPLAGLAYGLALAAAFVLWFAVRRGPEAAYRRTTFRLRGISAAVLVRLPLVALPLMVMTVASLVLVPRLIPLPPHRDTMIEAYARLPYGILTILVIAAVVAPLLEEFFFRGWVQTRLEQRLSAGRAIVLTAIIFSAAHFELFGFPTRLLFGLVAGYVAWSTRSIWPGVALHGTYNATLLLGGTGGAHDVSEGDLTRWAHTPAIFWPTALVFLAAGVVLVLALRAVERAARR